MDTQFISYLAIVVSMIFLISEENYRKKTANSNPDDFIFGKKLKGNDLSNNKVSLAFRVIVVSISLYLIGASFFSIFIGIEEDAFKKFVMIPFICLPCISWISGFFRPLLKSDVSKALRHLDEKDLKIFSDQLELNSQKTDERDEKKN